jgi:hypothetical protein
MKKKEEEEKEPVLGKTMSWGDGKAEERELRKHCFYTMRFRWGRISGVWTLVGKDQISLFPTEGSEPLYMFRNSGNYTTPYDQ